MKFDAQHILLIIVAVLTAMEPAIADLVSPGWQSKVASLIAGVVAAITAVLSLFKTSPQDTKAQAETKPPSVPSVLGAFLMIFALVGCGLQGAVAPAVTAEACIQADVMKRLSILQIATDCGLDVLTVIQSLLNSTDPKVLASPAYAEATRLRAAISVSVPGSKPTAGSGSGS